MDLNDKILLLTKHRDNLEKAKTIEDYKAAHIAYIDCLIGQLMGDKLALDSLIKFEFTDFNKETA